MGKSAVVNELSIIGTIEYMGFHFYNYKTTIKKTCQNNGLVELR